MASFDKPRRGAGGRTSKVGSPASTAALDLVASAPHDHGLPAGAQFHPRIRAVMAAARFHGVELDPREYFRATDPSTPLAAELSDWLQKNGLWSRAVRLRWRDLIHIRETGPVVLLLADGGAGLMTAADPTQNLILVKDPDLAASEQGDAVDQLRLEQIWSGEALLLRNRRGRSLTDAPFTIGWLISLVLQERRLLRDIGIASLTLSFLTIFPPLLVMTVVDRVLTHHSYSTLVLLAALLCIAMVLETFLGHARRLIVLVVGTRLDTRLNLYVFNRLLRLPLDYFERHPAGETMHKIAQVYKVREFLTGKLLATFLDLMTLFVLLPFLFFLNPLLAGMVLACTGLIMLVILVSLRPLRISFADVILAETEKASVLGETIFGVKTIKSLALEPQRNVLWDERVANVGMSRLAFGKIANRVQTIITPIERFMSIGLVLVGAYLALDDTGFAIGALFAFAMLSMRVAQPLVALARLVEDYEGVALAIVEAASVLNRPAEAEAASGGLRPSISGAICFDDVSFTYGGTRLAALDHVTFTVPSGTMLGIVGRSGSGKSTLTRLLQGINRDYSGSLKIDGNDVREINLRHLRQSFGVVLQENFLFRGSIRDNIVAGRPGLVPGDVVNAARLAGAEEFIERMPNGYETMIEEGSPNLSGGQRQRLAIARALITNPRILILDEATNALDPESEALLNANLLRIASGRTMVIVSHRLSSLVDCDQILVLDKGKLVDIASHDVLLDRCAIYRQLWSQQGRRHQDHQEQSNVAPAFVGSR